LVARPATSRSPRSQARMVARYGEGVPERLQRLFRDSDRTRILGLIPVQALQDAGEMGHATLAIPDTALSAGKSTFGHAG